MMQMGLALLDRPTGNVLLADLTRARNVRFSTGEHGFDTLTCFYPCSLIDAWRLLDMTGRPHLIVTSSGATIWEGRLEDVAAVDGGARLTAFGYWRALYDVPYTALWSTTSVRDWQVLTTDDRADVYNDRYQLDTNNRLFITARKGEVFGTTGSAKLGALGYKIPDDSARQIVACTFDYAFFAPANWRGVLIRADSSWAASSVPMTLNGSGALQTGSQSFSFAGTDRLLFWLDYNAADAEYTGETGATYLKITNLRVKTATGTVTSDAIAWDLVSKTNAVNSDQISSSNALLQSPGLDLVDAVYEDEYPADILEQLCQIGDSSTPQVLYEATVWENRLLTLRPRNGTNRRTWLVDASRLEVERTLDTLSNSTYAVYQDASGRSLRTAIEADTNSIIRFGLTRREALKLNTADSGFAAALRSIHLNDRKNPRPRAVLAFRELYDSTGTRWPLFMARAGDRVTIRNLSPTLSTSDDRIRTLAIAETRYDADTDTLEIVPEAYLPRIELHLAQRQAKGL